MRFTAQRSHDAFYIAIALFDRGEHFLFTLPQRMHQMMDSGSVTDSKGERVRLRHVDERHEKLRF
jgi:hypothetical protein